MFSGDRFIWDLSTLRLLPSRRWGRRRRCGTITRSCSGVQIATMSRPHPHKLSLSPYLAPSHPLPPSSLPPSLPPSLPLSFSLSLRITTAGRLHPPTHANLVPRPRGMLTGKSPHAGPSVAVTAAGRVRHRRRRGAVSLAQEGGLEQAVGRGRGGGKGDSPKRQKQ